MSSVSWSLYVHYSSFFCIVYKGLILRKHNMLKKSTANVLRVLTVGFELTILKLLCLIAKRSTVRPQQLMI